MKRKERLLKKKAQDKKVEQEVQISNATETSLDTLIADLPKNERHESQKS